MHSTRCSTRPVSTVAQAASSAPCFPTTHGISIRHTAARCAPPRRSCRFAATATATATAATTAATAATAAAATATTAASPTRAIDVGVARVRPRSSTSCDTRCDTRWGDGGQHVVVEVVCEPVSATDDT